MKVLDTDFARNFIRLCNDGFAQGWHEANGGNASYRLTREEAAEVKANFRTKQWVHLSVALPELAGEFFLITASGSYFRNIASDPKRTLGIIEIDLTGTSWRECWGFKDEGAPTCELILHLLCQHVRKVESDMHARVLLHAHPENVIALSSVLPQESLAFSRMLSTFFTESYVVFPDGIAVVPWFMPGSAELAEHVSQAMKLYGTVVVPQHGVFVSADSMDEAFGMMHTLDKGASIVLKARACGVVQPSISPQAVIMQQQSPAQAGVGAAPSQMQPMQNTQAAQNMLPTQPMQNMQAGAGMQGAQGVPAAQNTQPIIPKIDTDMPELSVDEVLLNFPGAIEGAGYTAMPQVVAVEEKQSSEYHFYPKGYVPGV